VVDEANKRVEFELLEGATAIKAARFDPSRGTVTRGDACCPLCGQVTKAKDTRRLARQGKMGERLVAVVLHHPCQSGKSYRFATAKDERLFGEASDYLEEKVANWPYVESPLPMEEIPLMSGTFNAPVYGLDRWDKLHNARQKLVLVTLLEKIRASFDQVREDCAVTLGSLGAIVENRGWSAEVLAQAVIGYLGITLDEVTRFSTNLNVFKVDAEAVVTIFGRQAIPMGWDYFENAPLGTHGGTWGHRNRQVMKVTLNTGHTSGILHMHQGSCTSLDLSEKSFDAVLTDPPYYNSVPYADLSDFFYVWLKRTVGDLFPDLFSTPLAPKAEEICEMAGWDSQRYGHKDKAFFENKMTNCLSAVVSSIRLLQTVTGCYHLSPDSLKVEDVNDHKERPYRPDCRKRWH